MCKRALFDVVYQDDLNVYCVGQALRNFRRYCLEFQQKSKLNPLYEAADNCTAFETEYKKLMNITPTKLKDPLTTLALNLCRRVCVVSIYD